MVNAHRHDRARFEDPADITQGAFATPRSPRETMAMPGTEQIEDGSEQLPLLVDRMSKQIDELLDLSRLRAGQPLELHTTEVSATTLARDSTSRKFNRRPERATFAWWNNHPASSVNGISIACSGLWEICSQTRSSTVRTGAKSWSRSAARRVTIRHGA